MEHVMKLKENKSELIIFRTKDGEPGIQVRFEEDTVWLTQKLIGELFEKDSDTIGLHLKNIYAEGELDERATTEDYSVVQKEGKRQVSRRVKHYNALVAMTLLIAESKPVEKNLLTNVVTNLLAYRDV